jgi:hypothetical protein
MTPDWYIIAHSSRDITNTLRTRAIVSCDSEAGMASRRTRFMDAAKSRNERLPKTSGLLIKGNFYTN